MPRWFGLSVGWVCILGVQLGGCGGEESITEDSALSGGAGGTVNATSANAGGTASTTGTVTGASTDTINTACAAYCDAMLAQTECTPVLSSADCIAQCTSVVSLVPACSAQATAHYACHAVSEWVCDATTNEPYPASESCTTENTALTDCLVANGTPVPGVEAYCEKMAAASCTITTTAEECANNAATFASYYPNCLTQIQALFSCYGNQTLTCGADGYAAPADSSACSVEETAADACTGL